MSHLYISESPILGICHTTECCEVRVSVIAYSERGFLCILGNISHLRPTRATLFRCCQNLGPAWQSSGRDVYHRILQTCHFRGSKDMETERPRIRSTGWSPVYSATRSPPQNSSSSSRDSRGRFDTTFACIAHTGQADRRSG